MKSKNIAPSGEPDKKQPFLKRILGKLAVKTDQRRDTIRFGSVEIPLSYAKDKELVALRNKTHASIDGLVAVAKVNRGVFDRKHVDGNGVITKVAVRGDQYGIRSSISFLSDNPASDLVLERVKPTDSAQPTYSLRRFGEEPPRNEFLQYLPGSLQEGIYNRVITVANAVVAEYYAEPMPKNLHNINEARLK